MSFIIDFVSRVHDFTSAPFQYRRGEPDTRAQKGQKVFERFSSSCVYLGAFYGMPFKPVINASILSSFCISNALMRPYKGTAKDHIIRIGDTVSLWTLGKGIVSLSWKPHHGRAVVLLGASVIWMKITSPY